MLAAVALTTAQRFGNQLVWDDLSLMEVAESLHASGDALRVFGRSMVALVHDAPDDAAVADLDLYRPLPLLTFVAGYAWSGREPVPQHAFNLGLHLSCTLLVFMLARRRGGAAHPGAALLAATWFGLAPHLAEAHVWISGRFDLMCALFVLASLHLSRAATTRRAGARLALEGAVFVAYLFALLSKEAAVFALLPLALWPESHASWGARVRRCAPFAAALVPYFAARTFALGGGGVDFDLATMLSGLSRFGAVVVDAVTSLLLPLRVYSRLPKEDYDALGAGGLVACGLLTALLVYSAWRARGKLPWWSFGIAWLLALLLPVALVSARAWPGFGRYLYLPSALFFVGAADVAVHAYAHVRTALARRTLHLALGAQLFVQAASLHAYTYDWHDDIALFSSIIAAAPERSHGYGFLGITYVERREFGRAAVLLQKAVSIAPDDRRFLGKLGHALLFSGQREAARALARDAIERLPDAPEFHLLEAFTFIDLDPVRAARGVLECLRSRPSHEEALQALAFLRMEHPQAARYRSAFAHLVEQPRYAALRPLLAAPAVRR